RAPVIRAAATQSREVSFLANIMQFFSCVCLQSYKRSYKISCIEWRQMANGQGHPRQAVEPSAFVISLSKGNGRPLFIQLHEQIIARISAGELTAGARLPPVRRGVAARWRAPQDAR